MNTEDISSLTKAALRRSMQTALRGVDPAIREAGSARIRETLKQDAWWVPARGGIVAMFGGIRTEPDLVPLLPWLAERGVQTAFFAITGEIMTPRLVDHVSHLQAGQLGVLEPDPLVCREIAVADLDVVLLPGLAFSRATGARLGRGKGHYDRVLERLPAERLCIGICFSLQLHDHVPLETHDRHVQALVTEEGWLNIPG